jgi:filamentous hemagglutinin
MAILSKGATIVADTQVSATNLNNLVDAATFVSGAVDGTTTQLSSGAIIVKDGGITPAKISTGGPSWTSGGTVSATAFSGPLTGAVTGNVTGNASTATAFATARTISITGDLAYTSPSFDGTGNVTAAGTLATVATAGTTGSSTAIPVVTINAKGLTTSITTAAVVAPAGTLSGSTLASGVTASSLTSVGTLGSLTVTNPIVGSVTGSSGSTTGNAATATNVAYSGLTGTVPTWNQNTTGNADTATKIASITNSDIVQLTASQTLTNKTLTSPTITGTGAIAGNFTGPITGNVIASIANITLLDLVPEFGYATSGTITLNLAAASNAKIELAGNSTFALSGIDSGQVNIVALKNNTGGSINTTWPAWTSAGGTFPASLTSGQAMVVSLYSYGSTTGSVYAVSSL